MRLNYDNYPILEKLEKGIFGKIGMTVSDSKLWPLHSPQMDMLRDNFKANIPYYKKSIKFIVKPLQEAIEDNRDKLLDLSLILNIGDAAGTIIIGDFQFCYKIQSTAGDDQWLYSIYVFNGYNFIGLVYNEHDGELDKKYFYASSLVTGNDNPTIEERGDAGKRLFGLLLTAINFLKCAEIETKFLPPSRQIWDGPTCLYNNKSKYPIEIIDSTWFTTLVKSDGFKVRGHLRLQPYGEGMTKRKLVWINEFQKNGYTRRLIPKVRSGLQNNSVL
jgi:hypothetical protein